MAHAKIVKSDFKYDKQGRVILGSAQEMAAWVKIGFKEQRKMRSPLIPYWKNYIDLSNCVLYVSYPIDSKEPVSEIFNLCDIAGVVPGIEKVEGDPNYLFEVTMDIRLDGSELYGNFFHYVKFNGEVKMDNVTVKSNSSCFKCLFQDYVYMQHIRITGRSDFEQCEFRKGLVLTGGKADLFHFNNCTIDERLWLSSIDLENHHHDGYHQSIELTNCSVENLNLSAVNTNGLPVYLGDSKINGMHIDNVTLDNTLFFNTCSLDGIITTVKEEDAPNNRIKEVVFHSCEVKGQYHIENSDIGYFTFNFSNVGESGRLRLSQCMIQQFVAGCSSVFGQMDLTKNAISEICLEGTCIQGYLNFQSNKVKEYTDRQTLCLLKNESIKVNDEVSAQQLYAKEMQHLLSDKSVSLWDKASLWLNKTFSKYGESWARAIMVTILLSLVFTLLMLGLGSEKYKFDVTGEFIGVGAFVTVLLDSINVFSIPLFSDTIKEYDLNVFGQILYYVIKVIVAYGSYQFVVAFRKYGRR